MSCNSCSNITLPGSAGVAGPQGPAGDDGSPGLPGPAGSSVSVIDYVGGIVSSAFDLSGSSQWSVPIPANTWSSEDDIVELEMLFHTKGDTSKTDQPKIQIKLGGTPIKLYDGNSTMTLEFLSDLSMSTTDNNIIKVRLLLPCFNYSATSASMSTFIEATKFRGFASGVNIYSQMASTESLAGHVSFTPTVTPPTSAVDFDLYMARGGLATLQLLYGKLMSYKKIT